jgi:diacylglycerol kinase (ATP)
MRKLDDKALPESGGPSLRDTKSVLRSFRFAWEGLYFVFTTQKHMRVHVLMITLVLIAAWGLGVTTYELLHLLSAFALVLITEMINTAIEQTVDLTVTTYDPRAKVAKDVAAGAVMLAAAYAVVVGTLGIATSDTFWSIIKHLPEGPPPARLGPVQAVLIGAILMGIFITWAKQKSGHGTFWRGGVISGHTALGFLIATSIVIITRSPAVACLALALALLISQSRIQARIHSPLEVVIGGVLGIVVAIIIFLPINLLPFQ